MSKEIKLSLRLKILRGINSQQDIAEAIGATLGAYKMWETGKREPSLSTLVSLSEKFNISLDYLIGTSDLPSINQEDNHDEIERVAEGIANIIRSSPDRDELMQSLNNFSNALSVAASSNFSESDFIKHIKASQIDSRNGVDIPQTEKSINVKFFDFSSITSREKAIRDKMNIISEDLQEILRIRGSIKLGFLDYSIEEKEASR